MAKTASNQLGICLRIMHVRPVPKVSIFMAVTTKKVTEKAQKWAKMATFWPKTHYNGRDLGFRIYSHKSTASVLKDRGFFTGVRTLIGKIGSRN